VTEIPPIDPTPPEEEPTVGSLITLELPTGGPGTETLPVIEINVDERRLSVLALRQAVTDWRLNRAERSHDRLAQSATVFKEAAAAYDVTAPRSKETYAKAPLTRLQHNQAKRADLRKRKANAKRSINQFYLKEVFGDSVGTPEFNRSIDSQNIPKREHKTKVKGSRDFNKNKRYIEKLEDKVAKSARGEDIPGKFIGARVERKQIKSNHLRHSQDHLERLQGYKDAQRQVLARAKLINSLSAEELAARVNDPELDIIPLAHEPRPTLKVWANSQRAYAKERLANTAKRAANRLNRHSRYYGNLADVTTDQLYGSEVSRIPQPDGLRERARTWLTKNRLRSTQNRRGFVGTTNRNRLPIRHDNDRAKIVAGLDKMRTSKRLTAKARAKTNRAESRQVGAQTIRRKQASPRPVNGRRPSDLSGWM